MQKMPKYSKRLLTFVLPTLVFLAALLIFPLIYSFVVSFLRWDLTSPHPSEFIGFRNYLTMIHDSAFVRGLSNSILMVLLAVSFELVCGLGIALIFSKEIKGRRLFRTLLILPLMTLPVVTGYIWRMMFHYDGGPINDFIVRLGFSPVGWLLGYPQGVFAIVIADVWQWTPFVAMVLLAAFQSLPKELVDSARVDGASSCQVFWHVSLPLVFPVFLIVTLLRIIDVFKLLDPVFILTGGGPGISTLTISLHTYYVGLRYFNMGLASASSYAMVIFCSVVVVILIRAMRRV
jgi:multiple sugar transport system permease protein